MSRVIWPKLLNGSLFPPALSPTARTWLELLLSGPVVLWAGWPFFERWAQSIANRSPNMWTLISLGTGAAFVYSVVATVAPGIFPASFVSMGRVAVYFEAASAIISLTLLGQVMELRARSGASAAIRALLGLAPKTARRVAPDGSEEDVPLAQVHVDELLRMGANIKTEGNAAVILGNRRLTGAPVKATDLRAGAALIIAGLAAEGESAIGGLHHIDRGYEGLVAKFAGAGAGLRRAQVADPLPV